MKPDLTGTKFGELLVLRKSQKNGTGVFYACMCFRCGNEKDIRATKLRGGANTTCGCGRTTPDISGEKFNRLTVVSRADNKGGQAHWKCICECGKETTVAGSFLRRGITKSCGCLRKEVSTNLGNATFRHGMEKTSTHHSWSSMLSRCRNKLHSSYKNYGGRGISVCQRWVGKSGFQNFFSDMGARPNGMTLDRIDVNGNYEPHNCRWATIKEQHRNTRFNRLIEFNGETKTIAEFSEIYGINDSTLGSRIRSGWTAERALTTPPRSGNNQYKSC